MNKRKFEKVCSGPNKISRKIQKTAEYLIDNEITFDGSRLTGEARNAGIVFIGTTMAVGENLTKGKYLRQGFCIGVATTIGVGVVLLAQENIQSKKAKKEKFERKSYR